MAHVWADRVAETTTTTGTGALTLAGAITGYFRFSSAKRSDGTSIQIGDTLIYGLEAVDGSGAPTGDSEWGVGTYSALNTLTRTTPLGSSNGGSVVTLAAGTKNVWLDDIASTRNTLQQYSGTSEPSAPVEGLINFSKDFSGWPVAMARGAANRSFSLNPFMGGRASVGNIVQVPNGTPTTLGGFIASTNPSSIVPAATNQYTAIARAGCNTTATASSSSSLRSSLSPILFRGAAANSGFRFSIAGGMETVGNSNCRWFMGLLASASAPAATVDPATATNFIGIGCTGTDTNAQLYHNDATAGAVALDLGASFPGKTAQGGFIEAFFWAAGSSATAINYYIRRLDDLTITPVTGSLTTRIPVAAQMFPHWYINNNATAAASVLAAGNAYWETGI